MELIYSVVKSSKSRRDWGPEENPICCLSKQNLIAFSSTSELTTQQKPSASDVLYDAGKTIGGLGYVDINQLTGVTVNC